MLKREPTPRRKLVAALLVATGLIGSTLSGAQVAWAAGGRCALVPNDRDPSEKILQCGQELTIRPAHGTRYQPVFKAGQQLPTAIQLCASSMCTSCASASDGFAAPCEASRGGCRPRRPCSSTA